MGADAESSESDTSQTSESDDERRNAPPAGGRTGGRGTTIAPREYAAYYFYSRGLKWDSLLLHGPLLQELIVDEWVKIETHRVNYFASPQMQKKLRAELYKGVADALNRQDVEGGNPGVTPIIGRKVLPSGFTGGPRHMQQLYQVCALDPDRVLLQQLRNVELKPFVRLEPQRTGRDGHRPQVRQARPVHHHDLQLKLARDRRVFASRAGAK